MNLWRLQSRLSGRFSRSSSEGETQSNFVWLFSEPLGVRHCNSLTICYAALGRLAMPARSYARDTSSRVSAILALLLRTAADYISPSLMIMFERRKLRRRRFSDAKYMLQKPDTAMSLEVLPVAVEINADANIIIPGRPCGQRK